MIKIFMIFSVLLFTINVGAQEVESVKPAEEFRKLDNKQVIVTRTQEEVVSIDQLKNLRDQLLQHMAQSQINLDKLNAQIEEFKKIGVE